MKKVNLLLIAVFVAASAMFVGCEADPSDEPTIKITFGNVVQDEDDMHPTITVGSAQDFGTPLAVHLEFDAPGGLKEVRIRQTAPTSDAGNYGDYPMTSGFDGKNLHKETITVTRPEGHNAAYTATYILDVFDNDKVTQEASKQFSVTFVAYNPTQPLSTADPFVWTKQGTNAGTGDGLNVVGLQMIGGFGGQTPNTFVRITPATGTDKFVLLAPADWEGTAQITTREALKAKIDATAAITGSDGFAEISANGSQNNLNHVLGTKVGDNYYMIRITSSGVQAPPAVPATTVTINGSYKSGIFGQ